MEVQGQEVQRDYRVAQGTVMLDITIGEAQIGASAVFLDELMIATGKVDDLKIGPGSILKGRRLSIRSIVSDVNPNTNRTAVTYDLSGGEEPLSVTLTADSGGDNKSVVYLGFFDFV